VFDLLQDAISFFVVRRAYCLGDEINILAVFEFQDVIVSQIEPTLNSQVYLINIASYDAPRITIS
jgi:hypothetical protein